MTAALAGVALSALVRAEVSVPGMDFAWLTDQVGIDLRRVAGGLLAAALIGSGIAVCLGAVTLVAARCGLPVGAKVQSVASGGVVGGLIAAFVLGTVAGAVAYYADIPVGW